MKTELCVLIVEDDSLIADFLNHTLMSFNYTTLMARTAFGAIHAEKSGSPDLVLLDLGLPDADGTEVIIHIRRRGSTIPIIVVSSRTSTEEKVKALDLGADDYIIKPFDTSEFMARIKAALRRRNNMFEMNFYKRGDLTIDFDKRLITRGAEIVFLTNIEYRIISMLSRNSGRAVTYEDIISDVWGSDADHSNEVLRVNISNIRKKLRDNPADPEFIYNVSGIGYKMSESERR